MRCSDGFSILPAHVTDDPISGKEHDCPGDAIRPNESDRVGNHLPDARALDDNIRLESNARNGAAVLARTESADELRFGSRISPIEDVNVQGTGDGHDTRALAARGAGRARLGHARRRHRPSSCPRS